MDDRQLRTVWENRQSPHRTGPLAEPVALLMKHTLGKRVKQLGAVARAWDECIPEPLRSHTALESYGRGTLTVMVDTAAWRFHLEMLLKGGLQRALAERLNAPLNKVRIIPGQFYSVDLEGQPRYEF